MFVQSPPQPPPSPHAAAPAAPFTPHEHALFVEGVEVFCNQSGAPVGDAAWRHIAAHVRTRTPDEIKAHAQYYLMSLQSRNPEITRVPPRPVRAAARGRRAGTRAAKTFVARARATFPIRFRGRASASHSRPPRLASTAGTWTPAWSPAENKAFENALATYEEGDADRWTKIAALLPAKSAADVQQWYERLLGDLLEIERGAGQRG